MQLAAQAPDMHNMHEVFRDMYEALGVTDIDRIMKVVPTDEPVPLDPAQENINVLDMLPLRGVRGAGSSGAHHGAYDFWLDADDCCDAADGDGASEAHFGARSHCGAGAGGGSVPSGPPAGGACSRANEQEMLEIEKLTAQLVAQGMQQLKELSGQMSGAGAPDPLVQLKEQSCSRRRRPDQMGQSGRHGEVTAGSAGTGRCGAAIPTAVGVARRDDARAHRFRNAA
jgi:hypothetical protein